MQCVGGKERDLELEGWWWHTHQMVSVGSRSVWRLCLKAKPSAGIIQELYDKNVIISVTALICQRLLKPGCFRAQQLRTELCNPLVARWAWVKIKPSEETQVLVHDVHGSSCFHAPGDSIWATYFRPPRSPDGLFVLHRRQQNALKKLSESRTSSSEARAAQKWVWFSKLNDRRGRPQVLVHSTRATHFGIPVF